MIFCMLLPVTFIKACAKKKFRILKRLCLTTNDVYRQIQTILGLVYTLQNYYLTLKNINGQ